jgi:hypothetical protein
MATKPRKPPQEDDVQQGVGQARAALFLLQELQSGDLRYLRNGVIVLGENRHIPATKTDLELVYWLTEMVVDSLEEALGDIQAAYGKVRDGKEAA